ncbi:uncharacterized protein LOC107829852 [Nicotiana tabacum]|uniref:Uncharacterized protein LOC107829852 n=1 Tax=Nicotiana tabacum TaxID=4097 RepID=A0AC58SN18_TOBAC
MTITRFFKAIPTSPSSGTSSPFPSTSPCPIIHDNIKPSTELNKDEMLNLDLKPDPAERKQISEYSPNLRDRVRRYYIKEGPCQPQRFNAHIGEVNSLHNRCLRDLMNQEQSILTSFDKQSEKAKSEYRLRLTTSIDVARFLIKQGMPFRGHNEGGTSTKRGNFLELLQCAKETMKAIVKEMNGDYFGILVDESKDVSHKEQMSLAIYSLLLERSLSRPQIRRQGYDGASNMQGEINGLKTLILKDTLSAYCVHCFAHQLQLTLVAVAKKHYDVDQFFDIVTNVLNTIGSSFKRR